MKEQSAPNRAKANRYADSHFKPVGRAVLLAAIAFAATGCPHNQYLVQLKPNGDAMDRTLVFYREDGVNTNTGVPNYQAFDSNELAAIAAVYPPHSLTNQGQRYEIQATFTNNLPDDVGGAGTYTHLATTLGEADLYAERFRGNDDLAEMTEQRFKAADQLADLILGWSRMQLGREPGYDKLREFLDVDFRRDLKNLTTYWWEGQLVSGYKTNADQEFAVRFGQYLWERGYFTTEEIPAISQEFSDANSQPLLHRIQRLVARKMGVPDAKPIPPSLAFLGDEKTMSESFDKYLSGTPLYHARLKQWHKDRKHNPKLKRPQPSDVAGDLVGTLIGFDLFGQPDHLVVQLSLPAAPDNSNGRWEEALKQEVWETDIEDRTNASHFPYFCYANWSQAAQDYQKEHLGKVALTGDDLTKYCLWRASLDKQKSDEWDTFISSLQPGGDLTKTIDGFRFAGEPAQAGTNAEQIAASPSAYPRELLKAALRQSGGGS